MTHHLPLPHGGACQHQARGDPSPVRDSYLAEVVLLLIDRLDDLEQRLDPSTPSVSPVLRRGLAELTQEDRDAFLTEYGEYVMDGWGDLRAFRTALGSLLVRLSGSQNKAKGGESEPDATISLTQLCTSHV
jgi:hypothetical protein